MLRVLVYIAYCIIYLINKIYVSVHFLNVLEYRMGSFMIDSVW